jgi:asparagine synthase (glutamine-hydrolysing)
MCGIAGYKVREQNRKQREALGHAVAKLKHRGPDGTGFYFANGVGLGHSRLAIIDLHTGDQPLYNEDRSVVLIVNGEFYNYRELQNELLDKGHQFKTKSDSEIFLHLYEDQPIADALNRLNGMWALALWDSRKKRMVVARDRVGKKPLYYVKDRSRFIFASEIKALKQFPGLDLAIDETALALYLKYGYVPSPYSIYQSIRKFPAASYGIYENNQLIIRPYWSPPDKSDPGRTEEQWMEELSVVLDDAVRIRLLSDVPLGAFLSGGIDSSLIVGDMVHHVEGRVKSFCIGFDDPSYDESAYSEKAATYFQTEHHTHRIKWSQVEHLSQLALHFDEPFADASFLPTWHLCRSTRKHVTVALSGDGGDELFGGYRRYLAGRLSEFYLHIPSTVREFLMEPIVAMLPSPGGYYGKSFSKKAKLFISTANRFEKNPTSVGPHLFADEDISLLFPGLKMPAAEEDPLLFRYPYSTRLGRAETMLRTDFLTYLPDDILVKVDRMSMYHALEVRCPFLDYRVVELAHQMPMKYKIRCLASKWILRNLARTRIPPLIRKRNKQGFMVPLDLWFRNELKSFILDLLSESGVSWSKRAALELFEEHQRGRHDHALKLWSLAVLGLWSKQ